MINEYFDKIFYINLDRSVERNRLAQEEFKKHGLHVDRVSGVDGKTLKPTGNITPGEMGCSLSHSGILKNMVENNWKRILVLEDDVVFIDNLQTYFKESLGLIPDDWDMLYFGGNHLNPPVAVNKAISRITRSYTTSHYGINLGTAKAAIDRIEKFNAQVDVVYSEFHTGTKTYTFHPPIAWQRPGISDIHNAFTDYTSFMKPKNTKP